MCVNLCWRLGKSKSDTTEKTRKQQTDWTLFKSEVIGHVNTITLTYKRHDNYNGPYISVYYRYIATTCNYQKRNLSPTKPRTLLKQHAIAFTTVLFRDTRQCVIVRFEIGSVVIVMLPINNVNCVSRTFRRDASIFDL